MRRSLLLTLTPNTSSFATHFASCSPGKKLEDDGTNAAMHDSPEDCLKCPPGFYSNAITGLDKCAMCPDGQVSPAGASACSFCPAGYDCSYGTTSFCPVGKYSNGETGGGDEPTPSCIICGEAYMCPGGTDHVPCFAGTYQAQFAQKECIPCEAGKYQANEGTVTCRFCPAGYFCPRRSEAPVPCGSVALFCPHSSGIVTSASEGYYTIPEDEELLDFRTYQRRCEKGSACSGGVRIKCDGVGEYADEEGLSACKNAHAGAYANA